MTSSITVVTGASSGIGAATAQRLAARGHRVALLGRNEAALATVTASLPPVTGGPHLAITCDVTQADQVESVVSQISEEAGVPTALVNAAGICVPAPLEDLSVDGWMTTLNTNLTGTFLISKAVAGRIRSAGLTGSIVNLGAEAASIGMPHYVAYCASKAGVVGLTRAMAAELAPHVRVNALCPGPVDTPMLRAELAMTSDPDAAWEAEIARVPLRKVASAAEVADAAVFLLTAPNATATVLSLDGGTTSAFYGVSN